MFTTSGTRATEIQTWWRNSPNILRLTARWAAFAFTLFYSSVEELSICNSSSFLIYRTARFQVWFLGRQYSARYDLAELRHLVTSRPWLTYRWKSKNVGSKIITWQRLTITQERLSCHWCIWPDKWPRLGLHAQMWSDGPRRGTSRY